MRTTVLTLCFTLALAHCHQAIPLDTNVLSDELSEFWLEVEERLTMADFANEDEPVIVLYNITDQRYYKRSAEGVEPYAADDRPHDFSPADGLHRLVTVVNGTMPGPTLVVRENNKIKVHVTNKLQVEVTSIHFHGMRQHGSFYSDGAAPITQCAIRPGERFTYEFIAEPAGTFWYHAHVGAQRGNGLFGAFIVLPTIQTVPTNEDGDAQVPDEQYVIMLSDWFPHEAHKEYSFGKWDIMTYYPSYRNLSLTYAETRAIDGSIVGETVFHALLINGKGWSDLAQLKEKPWLLPLEVFRVQAGKRYLVRVINTAVNFPQIFSIDEHQLLVVATDGPYVVPTLVDYVIVYPGERYDMWVIRKEGGQCTQCFMKSQTLEHHKDGSGSEGPIQHFTLAYWSYDMENIRPQTSNLELVHRCSTEKPCVVLSCPFPFPVSYNFRCIFMDELRALTPVPISIPSENDDLIELFVNLFDDRGMNGISFRFPRAPPALYPGNEESVLTPCVPGTTACTQVWNIDLGATVQLTLYNRIKAITNSAMELDAFAHPMHLHGYNFQVLKIGRGVYDTAHSGILNNFNQDIDCQMDDDCNNKNWTNSDILNGRAYGLNKVNPVVKDTVVVPMGGYVIVRFKADNPGWWLLHCHIVPHQLNGMSLLLRVGKHEHLPPLPNNFPKC